MVAFSVAAAGMPIKYWLSRAQLADASNPLHGIQSVALDCGGVYLLCGVRAELWHITVTDPAAASDFLEPCGGHCEDRRLLLHLLPFACPIIASGGVYSVTRVSAQRKTLSNATL